MFEQEVAITAPDQSRDQPMTVFAAWPEGRPTLPGVILYMDLFGLREEIFAFARRFADRGYAAFVPDLFHRLPVTRFAPANTEGQPVDPAAFAANSATTLEHGVADTAALLHYIDTQTPVTVPRLGTVGYCMGGRHALAAAVANPDRIPAAASIHGGRLVNDTAQSPHLLLNDYRGEVYFAFAENDSTCPDDHQALIEQTLATAPAIRRVCYLAAAHGFTFPDRWCYDAPVAEAAWSDVLGLFERHLQPG